MQAAANVLVKSRQRKELVTTLNELRGSRKGLGDKQTHLDTDVALHVLAVLAEHGDAAAEGLVDGLQACLATQLLGVQRRAFDRVEDELAGVGEQGVGFGEEALVACFQLDGLDEHWVAGVFVWHEDLGEALEENDLSFEDQVDVVGIWAVLYFDRAAQELVRFIHLEFVLNTIF